MKAPTNTAKRAQDDPFFALLTAAPEGGIERQEAQGQREIVNSDVLPSEIIHGTRADLEAAGVRFGDPVDGDPMFTYVTLPEGWKKVSTDHSMWSKLVDDRGRERAGIFYKAAFYDRKAHLGVTPRFGIAQDYSREDIESAAIYQITDCGKVVHVCEPVPYPKDGGWKPRSEAGEKAYAAAKAWLAEHYPDWTSNAAYWE